jgi:iron(III) transport system permease protein
VTAALPDSMTPARTGVVGGRARRPRRPPVLLVVPALLAASVAVVPLWYLADRALERGWREVVDELWRRRTLDLVLRSLSLTAAVTVLCIVIGVTAAWLVTRSDLRGRRVLRVLFALPLAVPSYLSAFAWVSWKPWLAGFRGATLVLVLVSYPFVYLPALGALRHLDPAQEEVARSLGRHRLDVAVRLTIRQIRPAITAGALLVALYVLSDFGAVATMRYEVFTWVIYGAYRAGFNPSRAAILALVLVGLALALVAAEARARGRVSAARLGAGAAREATPVRLGRAAPLAWLFIVVILGAAIGFPVQRIIHWVTTFTSTAVDTGEVATALWRTLVVSLLAAVASIGLAVPVGVLAARYRSRSTIAIERSTYVAHALPGIVVAIALVFVGVRLLRPVYQEVPLLVLGYVVLFLPLAVGAVRASIEQSPVRLEEIARSLGSSPRAVLARVTAPLALPGIASGAALVFLSTMKELPVTLVLRPTGTETLATRLWHHTSVSDYANAGPYALALVVFAAVPTAILSSSLTARRGRMDTHG